MQIAGEEIERLRRQIMEQIDLTRTVEDEEVRSEEHTLNSSHAT